MTQMRTMQKNFIKQNAELFDSTSKLYVFTFNVNFLWHPLSKIHGEYIVTFIDSGIDGEGVSTSSEVEIHGPDCIAVGPNQTFRNAADRALVESLLLLWKLNAWFMKKYQEKKGILLEVL